MTAPHEIVDLVTRHLRLSIDELQERPMVLNASAFHGSQYAAFTASFRLKDGSSIEVRIELPIAREHGHL